ncbi:FkbM family methyltransferase [Kordiimonas pumila]|uniref:FkbM family methyltransferase n=1 Tax=Kordiimonas pumila TaxID=2161677 RepID=A0ABV7DA19_9PROT|nr:FkbM family methyltransferase [Kordiimonas pumila]
MRQASTELTSLSALKSATCVYLYEVNNYTVLLAGFLQQAGVKVGGFVQEKGIGAKLETQQTPILGFADYKAIWHADTHPLLFSEKLVINKTAPYSHMEQMGISTFWDPYPLMAPFKEAKEWFYIANTIRHYGNPKAGVFFDIGSNRGGATTIALEHYHRIIGIEANPVMQKLYQSLFADHHHVQLVPCAVGSAEQRGPQKFYIDVSESAGGSSLYAEYTERHIVNTIDEIDVTVKTLADICNETGLFPTFIKVDVEGSEPDVLLASLAIITEHQPVILFECWSDSWHKGVRDLYLALNQRGYTLYCTVAGASVWDVFEYGYTLDYVTNVVCLPQGSALPAFPQNPLTLLPDLKF